MSGVLQRLVGRATGAPVAGGPTRGEGHTGLRPRLPSRFEAGQNAADLQEIVHEQEGPTTTTAPSTVPPPEPTARNRLGAVTPEPLQSPHPRMSVTAQPSTTTPSEPAPDPAHTDTGVQPAPAPLLPPASSAAGFQDASQRSSLQSQELQSQEQLSLEQALASFGSAIANPQRPAPDNEAPHTRPPSPPAPLLPSDPGALTARLDSAITATTESDRRGNLPTQQSRSEPQEAPEINIHIGRLDIRSASPQPGPETSPAQHRSTPSRSLPSLSDYLRGGRS